MMSRGTSAGPRCFLESGGEACERLLVGSSTDLRHDLDHVG